MKEQDFAGGEREVEIWSLRHDAYQSLHLDLLCPYIVVANPRLTIRRPHACCQDAERGGLPGAIWTKQPEDLSAADVQRQSVQRNNLARRLVTLTTKAKPATRGKWRRRCIDLAQVARADTS